MAPPGIMPNALRELSLVAIVGFGLFAVTPISAASLTLTDGEREEAVRVGKRSVVGPGLGSEWKVEGTGGQTLTVMTPFHRVALAARNAAFRDEEPRPQEIGAIARDYAGKLVLWVTLRGGSPDFARWYSPVLLAGRAEIKATFVQNERTALPEGDGRFAARCYYVFPADRLDPKGLVTLVVRGPEDREVAKFAVDLGSMR